MGPELPGFKGYFVIQFDRDFENFATWNSFRSEPDINVKGTDQYGARMGSYVEFTTRMRKKVLVKIGTSFISIEQARKNLEIEIPHWDFDEVVNATGKTWSSSLDKFQIQGANEDQKTIFYTALFHTMLFPRE